MHNSSEDSFQYSEALTEEMKTSCLENARSVSSIKAFNPDGSLDADRTKEMRAAKISEMDLSNTEKYTSRFVWGEDENGLQMLVSKKLD